MSKFNIDTRLKISLLLALSIAVMEIIGGLLSNSVSLLSDAGHVFTDSLALGLSLIAVTLASRPHKGSMTFGYHRAEVLAALANGIALSAISVLVFIEAYERISTPKAIDGPVMLVFAIAGLAGNLVIVSILKSHSRSNINIKSAFVHVIYDTISSVAVITGAVFAVAFGIFFLDPIMAFLIAGLIARSAYGIVKESAYILLEAAPLQLDVNEILHAIKQNNEIIDVHDFHIWTISTGMHALSGHIVIRDQMLSDSFDLLETINKLLLERYDIKHTTLQMEVEGRVKFKQNSKKRPASYQ